MKTIFTDCRVVTMDSDISQPEGYRVREKHMIATENGVITAIGKDISVDGYECVSLGNRLVTPGLIDAHTHLIYAGDRSGEFEQRLQGVPYEQIAKNGGGILSTVKATRAASLEELVSLALPRANALIRDGVTTIEVKSGYGLTVGHELKMLKAAKMLAQELDVNISTTLLGAHALPPEFQHDSDSYISLVCEEMIPAAAEAKLADSVDVFCEGIGFSPAQMMRVFDAARKHGLNIKGHTEQLSNLGGSALAAEMGALSVDHIEYLNEDGVKALASSGTVATLLPGAFYFLRETQKPPVESLRKHNVPMAIATDFNPGTSPFASLTLMMNMASTLFGLTPQETLYGVTRHAAKALGLENKGQIAVGFDADFSVWDLDSPAQLSYQVGLAPLHARYLKGVKANDR
ncbi:imidazolonepropionase [Grimontia hollisae]|uniref:Imidazolonepropionase n=1 Tax=Grimontia hollisae CIP 101886 TaxID=675812 RepID=D0IAP5_GRIHO|nr:imidazolonepropionase [Grimontia hollisae]AUW37897.1 imidazolonepropionase [Grimontia hollisae]EEY70963.1 imidazolonepropionase [Grimontia hollisae CIP 101886]STO44450.1 Imidazolonepropionase [Grimontia hollisae]